MRRLSPSPYTIKFLEHGESQQGPHAPGGEQLLAAVAAAVALIILAIAILSFIAVMFAVISG